MPGVVTAFIAALCYSLSYICVRKGQTESNPGDNGLFPVLVVGGFTLAAALAVKMFDDPKPLVEGAKQEWAVLFCVLAGIIGTCFGRMALYIAIARLGATRGVIIDMLSPMVTLGIAVAFLGEKFRTMSIFGMLFIVLGMSLLLIERSRYPMRFATRIFRNGVLMGLAAAGLQGTGHVFRKPSSGTPISPTFAATLDILAALLVYILILAITGRLKRYTVHYVTNINRYFIAAGCLSAAGVLLFFTASGVMPVSQVSMITSIQPVLIALLSGLFLKDLEYITLPTMLSSVLVAFGVITLSL